MTTKPKLLSQQAINDTVRAFRIAIQLEQEELNHKRYYLRVATTQPVKDLLKKQIEQAEFEIHSLHFTFGHITGMAFDSELNIKPTNNTPNNRPQPIARPPVPPKPKK